jgi:hypothetical protein
MGGHALESSGSGFAQMAGSFEHGNEPSSSIKCGEFFDFAEELRVSQEGLCSTKSVKILNAFVDGPGWLTDASKTCYIVVLVMT